MGEDGISSNAGPFPNKVLVIKLFILLPWKKNIEYKIILYVITCLFVKPFYKPSFFPRGCGGGGGKGNLLKF